MKGLSSLREPFRKSAVDESRQDEQMNLLPEQSPEDRIYTDCVEADGSHRYHSRFTDR